MLDAFLGMKRALFDRITPFLRAVKIDLDKEREIYICYFYYDAPIDDELFDLASCAAAEASESWFCAEHILQWDFPKKIPEEGVYAYLRKEEGSIPPSVRLLERSKDCLPEAYLSYTLQQGLLGRVTASLRAVLINANDQTKSLDFYFFYDEEITDELRALVQEAVKIGTSGFPDTYQSTLSIEFLPYPQIFPDVGVRFVYKRKEE